MLPAAAMNMRRFFRADYPNKGLAAMCGATIGRQQDLEDLS
jgi:hypothetical protein